MPKAVIFDVDGTLVDSADPHAHAWVDTFRDYGHEIAFKDWARRSKHDMDQTSSSVRCCAIASMGDSLAS